MVSQEWNSDFEEAKQKAQERNHSILLLFSGSDWCAPCIKLEKEILSTKEFTEKAKDHYVLMKADFPRKKKNQLPEVLKNQNARLAEQYNKSGGFPMVVLLDQVGTKLGEIGYKKVSPKAYIELLSAMKK